MGPEAEQAVEQLWKHQLRRENAALFEVVDAQKVSIRQIEERVSALDAQMYKFVSDYARLAQDMKNQKEVLEDFRQRQDKIMSELRAIAERVTALKGETRKSQEHPRTFSRSQRGLPLSDIC
jgi:chromosome segregation ATPase